MHTGSGSMHATHDADGIPLPQDRPDHDRASTSSHTTHTTGSDIESSPGRSTFAAVSSTIVAVLPVFLLGALASLVRRDLGFGAADLGLAVGCFYGASALAAVPGGRIAERLGDRRALAVGILLSVSALGGIALVARVWWHLAALLVVGGVSNGISQPAGHLAIARGVPRRRHGIAFGLKQSAVSFATLVSGLAVPAIGLTIGWRWAYAGGAVLALSLLLRLPAKRADGSGMEHGRDRGAPLSRTELRSLVRVGATATCAAIAANSMGAFYVESAADAGYALTTAGLLLSFGSITSLGTRVVIGSLSDRWRYDHLRAVAVMLLLGAVGFLLLGFAPGLPMLVVGTLIGFTAGWGWPGLLQFGVVSEHMHAPAAATSIVHAGALTGGMIGPIGFGWIVSAVGYRPAWIAASVSASVGGCLLLWERRHAGGTVEGAR